jgi:hypothetical protein
MTDREAVEYTLTRYRFTAMTVLSREFAEDALLAAHENEARFLALRVIQAVWGKRVGEIIARYPADWRQAFKDRWLPEWARRRWPVRYAEVRLEVADLFPGVAVPRDARRAVIVTKGA